MTNGDVSRNHVFPPQVIIVKPPVVFPPPAPPAPPHRPDTDLAIRTSQRQVERMAAESRERQRQVDRLNDQMRQLDELRRHTEEQQRIRRIEEEQRRLREQHEALTRQLQRDRERLERLAREAARSDDQAITPEISEVDSIVDRYTSFFGLRLDESGLARELRETIVDDPEVVREVLDRLARSDAIQVAREVAAQLLDDAVEVVASTSAGRATLLTIVRLLGESDDEDDHRELQRVVRVLSRSHNRMLSEPWLNDPAIAKAAADADARIQPLSGGSGFHVFDEYTVTVERMPENLSPEQFIDRLVRDLNATVANSDFDCLTIFQRRESGDARRGEIVDIDILGPDNGSVMLVERESDHFTYATLTTPFVQTGEHPEWGVREFGFESNDDGSVTFYTRGVSRQDAWTRNAWIGGYVFGGPIGMLLASHAPAALQERAWSGLLKGIGESIERAGGHVRENGYGAWRTVPQIVFGVPQR
jgi:hypothetical protein